MCVKRSATDSSFPGNERNWYAGSYNYHMPRGVHSESGNTLVELMVAALVLSVFFVSIFEVSAVCLRYISSSKENVTGIECVQDRIEQLRSTDFASLIDPNYLAVTPSVPSASPSPSPPQRRNLTVPSNASELASKAMEEVTISTYSGGAATTPKVKYTRAAGAKINTTTNFADTNVTPSQLGPGRHSERRDHGPGRREIFLECHVRWPRTRTTVGIQGFGLEGAMLILT